MPRGLRVFTFLVALLTLGIIGLPQSGNPLVSSVQSQLTGAGEAVAQTTRKKRRSLFSILFGRNKAKRKAVRSRKRNARRTGSRARNKRARRTAKRNRRSIRRSSSRRRADVARKAVTAAAVQKDENAKVVLVIGDFFAGGLADGLEVAYRSVSGIRVVDRSRATSGFVRNDIIDWPAVLPALVAEVKPTHIVAMLGSNDRQLMREGGKRLKKRTPEWDAAYIKRVEALGGALKASGLPYTWLGLPPVRFKSMNKDLLVFNEMYRKAATSESGTYVDVWDGFSDAEGAYSRSGPDINGQIVLLRPKDGINLTKAGRRRLAFYVESLILNQTGVTPGAGGAVASTIDLGTEYSRPRAAAYDPARTGKTVVIRLNDPNSDGASALAGDKIDFTGVLTQRAGQPSAQSAPAARSSSPRVGRADSHIWPPVDAALPAQGSAPVASN